MQSNPSIKNFFIDQIDLRDDVKTIARLNSMKERAITAEQGHKLAREVL